MADDFEDEQISFVDRIKESPRTVSALIIILIVAAAIYAFSGEPKEGIEIVEDESADVTAESESTANPVTEETKQEPGEVAGEVMAKPTAVSTEQLMAESKALPEPTRTDEGFQEIAQTGDGITNIARRAATRWLSENQAGYAVSNEHRIYIEDYIQNQLGSQGLYLGESRTVSFDLIAEAVVAAGQLNDQQLRNLTQYIGALS